MTHRTPEAQAEAAARRRETIRAWHKKHGVSPERRKMFRAAWKKSKYGITIEEFDRLLEAQQGLCAICRQPETKTRNGEALPLSVDHCHVSGKIRGLLCAKCNSGLGHFCDNAIFLREAAHYLER